MPDHRAIVVRNFLAARGVRGVMRVFVLVLAAFVVAGVAAAGDPRNPVQARVVATGQGPCGIAARAGSIWVGVYGTGQLLGVDDRRGRIETRVRVGRWACRVAVGPAAIWVTRDRAGELVRVSRGTGRMKRLMVGSGTFDVLLASGAVWTSSFDTGAISKIDPVRVRMTRVFEDGANPAGLTYCNGRIWVGHGRDATWLTEIDPATNAIRRVDLGAPNPSWPRCVHRTLWVTASDTLLKVDPKTGTVEARVRLGGTLAEAGEGPDALVWVTDKERSLVHRVSAPQAAITDTFEAGPGAFALVRVGDSMWITSFAGADVRRFDR
jgi:streptogramin lyase